MSLKVYISVTKPYYMRPGVREDGYYQVMHESEPGGRYRWVWNETFDGAPIEVHGDWKPTIADALDDAAGDWEDSVGSVLTSDLARRLRLAAAAYKRQGS